MGPDTDVTVVGRAERQTRQSIDELVEQLRSPLGVIPFVGAGLSAPFGFPQWDELLLQLADGLPSEERRQVQLDVDREEYATAAAIVERGLGAYSFQSAIAARFPDAALSRVDPAAEAVGFVPLLASGLVITTNFDGVLEHVFEHAGRGFASLVYGANPNEIVPAIQRNRRTLWKLHGDRLDPRTRVLSDADYTTHYEQLEDLLELAFANRPALFLGCSLETDRTVGVLEKVAARWPGVGHFAVLQQPEDEKAFDARVAELRRFGVRPIWYPEGAHGEIRSHLAEIARRASGFVPNLDGAAPSGEAGAGTARAARAALARELALARSEAAGAEGAEARPPYPALLDRMTRGELAFFLGSGATLGRLPLALEFYVELRQVTEGAVELDDERVTQHYADRYGRGALNAKVDELLGQPTADPTALHYFLATLTPRLREKGYDPRPPLILTTNFDDWMEQALRSAGERYHLFSYRVDDPYAGQFVYRSSDGGVFVVDRPERFHEVLDDCPLVVKYHGGLHRDVPLRVSYAFARGDFVEGTRRLPEALPRVIRERLAESSLLFLGSRLADDAVEALLREHRRRNPQALSWAVQRSPQPGWPLYWSGVGVEILDIRLARFVVELNERLEALPERRA